MEPAVTVGPGGRTTFAWRGNGPGGTGIQARQFFGGLPESNEYRVDSHSADIQVSPSIASDSAGNFTVAWVDLGLGSDQDMYAQRFDAGGTALGGEFLVNSYTTGIQASGRGAVAAAADGRSVVVWESSHQDGSGRGVFAQRYDAAGAPAGPEFLVNEVTANSQIRPVVASDAAGNFVVSWIGPHPTGGGFSILARRFDADGNAQGGEFVVHENPGRLYTGGMAFDPASQDFVVVWTDYNVGDVRGRVFDAAGPVSPEFAVSLLTTWEAQPSVAFGSAGEFVVSWQSGDADGYGVVARRYRPDLIFADGFESRDVSRWSASADDGGDLSVSRPAAMDSTGTGLQGVVDDVVGLYVQDDSPSDEGRYRARFWMDANDFDPGVAQGHRRTRLFIAFSEAPARRVAAVVLRLQNGVHSVMGRARQDDNSQADTGFIELRPGPHAIELDLKAASGPDLPDGSFVLFVDGEAVAKLGNLDNSRSQPDFVRLGALSVKGGARGTLYWDEFESRRASYIGP
jgi:hypothetical protein